MGKAYRQTLQSENNTSKKRTAKMGGGGGGSKHPKALPYRKCMHLPKQGGAFC